MIEIPLTSEGAQRLSMTLDGVDYIFVVKYNPRAGIWSLDVTNQLTGRTRTGIAILIGGDIMSPYNIGIKNLYAINVVNPKLDATDSNLGTEVRLFVLTDEEVDLAVSI